MHRMKVMTVVGTRPEVIRLSRVMAALDRTVDHVLVHTGQNHDYELNEIFFEDLALRRPDHHLAAAGKTAAETVGALIGRMDELLRATRPDALLLLGDTNSCLAAYPAKRLQVPVFHMEAGNRCFDQRVPEEVNRVVVDHLSDVNLPYSTLARERLLAEGLPPDRVIKTGSPMLEVLTHYRQRIDASGVVGRLGLAPGRFYVASIHREENVEPPAAFAKVVAVLNALAERDGLPVVVSTHPRTRKRIEAEGVRLHPRVELLRPLGFCDWVRLELTARAVLSDSGTITEESSILDFPALNLREAHERPEGFEEAAVIMTGLDWSTIEQGLQLLEVQPRPAAPRPAEPASSAPAAPDPGRHMRVVQDYTAPNVSEKVVRIIVSYTGYVNRVVWRKG